MSGGQAMAFEITSGAFSEGAVVPSRFTCDGKNISPALSWVGVPAGTKSFALICDDPDAPMGTWVHWVIFNISPKKAGLPEGVPAVRELSDGTRQGINSFRRVGYGGPCPPTGPAHRYFFKLYALDAKLDLPAGSTKKHVLDAMKGHILGETKLTGQYRR